MTSSFRFSFILQDFFTVGAEIKRPNPQFIDQYSNKQQDENQDAKIPGKAKLTDDSTKEQAGAGLNTLSAEEFARFTDFNSRYRERFGFPFIFAVKGATKHMILDSFAARVGNGREAEFETALAQVCRIFRFRIEDRVSP